MGNRLEVIAATTATKGSLPMELGLLALAITFVCVIALSVIADDVLQA